MDTLSWMTLLLAIATFILAGAAFWTICQNYNLRKKDIKENKIIRAETKYFEFRLDVLNELHKWIAEAVKLGFEYNRSINAAYREQVNQSIEDIAKNTYVADLAIRLFENELKDLILNAMNVISGSIRKLTDNKGDKGIIGDEYYFDCLYKLMKTINEVKIGLYK